MIVPRNRKAHHFYRAQDAITLFGRDVKEDFMKELQKRGIDELKAVVKKSTFEKRFWTRYYYTGLTSKNCELRSTHYERYLPGFSRHLLLGQLIDNAIELSQFILFNNNVFVTQKDQIADNFERIFSTYRYKHIPRLMLECRRKWGGLSESEMERAKEQGILFLEDVCSRVIHEKKLDS